MIEETARVVQSEGDFAWVETERKSTCGSCVANKGCGVATLSKVLGQKRSRIRVLNTIQTNIGDRVVIGIEEDALVRGSFAMYAVPLLIMVLFSLLTDLALKHLYISTGETATIVAGITGLITGFIWLRVFSLRIRKDKRYQPVLLKKIF